MRRPGMPFFEVVPLHLPAEAAEVLLRRATIGSDGDHLLASHT
jgi:hypothetical protein